jgi:hypothetical protein
MMPSPPIDDRYDTRHSRWLAAGRAQARIALALFGRRPQERVDGLVIPASENLHRKRHPAVVRRHDFCLRDLQASMLVFSLGGRSPKGNAMKLPRRKFLHLAAGAAALPVIPVSHRRKPIRRGQSAS